MMILPNSLGDNILTIEQCTDRLKEISTRVRKKEMNKRLLAKYLFYITKNTKIYINIYTSIKKATKGKAHFIHVLLQKEQHSPKRSRLKK